MESSSPDISLSKLNEKIPSTCERNTTSVKDQEIGQCVGGCGSTNSWSQWNVYVLMWISVELMSCEIIAQLYIHVHVHL